MSGMVIVIVLRGEESTKENYNKDYETLINKVNDKPIAKMRKIIEPPRKENKLWKKVTASFQNLWRSTM